MLTQALINRGYMPFIDLIPFINNQLLLFWIIIPEYDDPQLAYYQVGHDMFYLLEEGKNISEDDIIGGQLVNKP